MVRQYHIPLDAPDEWKEALSGIRHAFAHTWENCHAMYLTTGFKTYLYDFEAEGVRIVCPISERPVSGYADIVTPMGFSGFAGTGDCRGFSGYWNKYASENGYVCGYIGQNPLFENASYFSEDEYCTYNTLYMIDLTLDQDILTSNLDRNRRRQLKNWDEVYDDLIFDREVLTEFFLANYSDFISRIGASGSCNYTKETLMYFCGLDNIMMVGAGKRGVVECVYLFAYTPFVAESFLAASLPEGRNYSFALTWYAVKYLKALGIPYLNLGGGVTENDGIAKFKQRFGSISLPLKCLKQVYDHKVYRQLCSSVNRDVVADDAYFPLYRKSSG